MTRQNCKNCGEPYEFDNLVTLGREERYCVACQRKIYTHTGQIVLEPTKSTYPLNEPKVSLAPGVSLVHESAISMTINAKYGSTKPSKPGEKGKPHGWQGADKDFNAFNTSQESSQAVASTAPISKPPVYVPLPAEEKKEAPVAEATPVQSERAPAPIRRRRRSPFWGVLLILLSAFHLLITVGFVYALRRTFVDGFDWPELINIDGVLALNVIRMVLLIVGLTFGTLSILCGASASYLLSRKS